MVKSTSILVFLAPERAKAQEALFMCAHLPKESSRRKAYRILELFKK